MAGYIRQQEGTRLRHDEVEQRQKEYRERMAAKQQADQDRLRAFKADRFSADRIGVSPGAITPGSDAQRRLIGERSRLALSQWGADGDGRWNGWKAPEPPPPPEEAPLTEEERMNNLLSRLDQVASQAQAMWPYAQAGIQAMNMMMYGQR